MKIEYFHAGEDFTERFNRLPTVFNSWSDECVELGAEEYTAPSIRYRVSRVKKYLRAIRNVVHQKCISVLRRDNLSADVVPCWDARDIAQIVDPGIFQGDELWVPIDTKRPKLRVINGGKSD